MKKAQITMFFVVGIVLLVIFGFLFYIKAQMILKPYEKTVEERFKDVIDKTSLKYYVTSCLDQAATNGLKIIGEQGGLIYDYQIEGTMPETSKTHNYTIQGKDYTLDFAIEKKRTSTDSIWPGKCGDYLTTPEYPYQGSLVKEYKEDKIWKSIFGECYGIREGYAGLSVSSMLALCNKNGSNIFDVAGAKWSCENELYNRGNLRTPQEFLKRYVENKTQGCVNASMINQRFGYNISFGDIEAEALFGETDVDFNLLFPITLTFETGKPIIKVLKFNINKKIRLKQIYELAYHMAKEDVKNIFFNLTNNQQIRENLTDCPAFNLTSNSRDIHNSTCLKQGMNVTKFSNTCKDCTTAGHIIRITDNGSIINGESYIFQFAIENRQPALDQISWKVNESYDYYWYIYKNYNKNLTKVYNEPNYVSGTHNYNITINYGDTIEIFPRAIDPDEDEITYAYSGWETDRTIVVGAVTYGEVSGNVWEESDYYKNGYLGNPKYKDANYKPEEVEDNYMQINVTDPYGLNDYQIVFINVKD